MTVSPVSSAAAHQRGERVTVRCGPMVHGGVCLATLSDGATLFVEHAIPGELAEVTLRFRKGRVWFGAATSVLEPSTYRVTPPCQYVPACGGCQLQHVAYPYQVTLKWGTVADALRRQGIAIPAQVRLHPAEDPWRYRIRGEFHVVPGEHGVEDAGLGFNRSRSWKSIPVDDCLIHHRRITDALPALRAMVRRGATPRLHTLRLTAGDDGAELLVRGNPPDALSSDAVEAAARETDAALGTEWTTLRWRGNTYRVRADTFVQVNWQQMDELYSRVLDGLGDYSGRRIIDAYAGIGVLGCFLAAGAEVVCIESNRAAVRTGLLNARLNGVAGSLRYVARPVESALAELSAEAPFDAVVLDPPRAGCDSKVTGWLALAGPRRVVYVSCDPATLARDLHVMVVSGPYEIASLDVVDMFPQSYHIECVVTLNRRPAQSSSVSRGSSDA